MEESNQTKAFILPSPKFEEINKSESPASPFTATHGMQLSREKQPPPMYVGRGASVPQKIFQAQSPKPTLTVLPPKSYFCEACEVEFFTAVDYKVHTSEHTQCKIDNCTFVAHPSCMHLHSIYHHTSGMYQMLKKFSTPEEIAQWRTDRKKNYPSVASVEQRWKAREERMKRGEKLGPKTSRFGNPSDRRQMPGDKKHDDDPKKAARKRLKKKHSQHKPATANPEEKKTHAEANQVPPVKKVDQPKPPTSEKAVQATKHKSTEPKLQASPENNALISLLGSYGSDSEDSDAGKVQKVDHRHRKRKPAEVSKGEVPGCSSNKLPRHDKTLKHSLTATSSEIDNERAQSDSDAPEEAPVAKDSGIPDVKPPRIHASPKPVLQRRSGLDYSKIRTKRQYTLLEKLLEEDIRHERNMLLQCVHFVVKQDFFGVGSNDSQP